MECEQHTIAIHFRMTGKLVQLPDDGRIRFVIGSGSCDVGFKDTRRLGEVRVLSPDAFEAWMDGLGLGPDAYPERFGGEWWENRFAKCRTPIKAALLRQELIAGIGNILASEICFLVGVDPTLPANKVSRLIWDAIAQAAPTFIASVIEAEMADEIAYIGEKRGVETTIFQVYGREGRPCRKCGSDILRAKQAQRSTFWCPRCQPAAS
jgi:formamidopyrimidine-DNA glycosylase